MPSPSPAANPPRDAGVAALALAATGIVYGDIGTSPLYAVRESFSGHFGVAPTPDNALGVLSLIAWSLVLIVSVKYLALVLRADNEGEGGILALTTLVTPNGDAGAARASRRRLLLVSVGLFGAAMLYGDGILTPAISVLSAVEGLEVAAPPLAPFVVPVTVAVLAGLFLLQRRGTALLGRLFGPVMLVWFVALGALGVKGILLAPRILAALNPLHGVRFLAHNGVSSLLVLGAVFLVVTGAEALYADMGHFGRRPIRFAWFTLVFPALLLNYLGQGALLLWDPEAARSPFYLLAPSWGLAPLVALSTLATIIASQAVVSGVFSLTMQAVQLGLWPRLQIRHTSATHYGQIYVPAVNWALAAATILLVLTFGSSAALAGAYGVAIVTTMMVTTLLLFVVAPERWGWPAPVARVVLTGFLLVEAAFFAANVVKIEHGGWLPLLIAGAVYLLFTTWRDGREVLGRRLEDRLVSLGDFLDSVPGRAIPRVPGNAVYMTGNPDRTPAALVQNLEHQKTLHERVVLVSVRTERAPRVRRDRRLALESLGHGFHRVTARYGFLERPDVLEILEALAARGFELPLADTTFFVGRERLVAPRGAPGLRWRVALFAFMSRNAQRATAFFNIPPDRVVEVGTQLEP